MLVVLPSMSAARCFVNRSDRTAVGSTASVTLLARHHLAQKSGCRDRPTAPILFVGRPRGAPGERVVADPIPPSPPLTPQLHAHKMTLLPGMLRVQGTESATFTPVPLDQQLSIPQLIDYHLAHSKDHPVMTWDDGSGTRETILWSAYGRAIHRVARIVADTLGFDLDKGERPPEDTHVAILAAADHQTYMATALGIVRAGCVAFPLSINNSFASTVHLLREKECALLIGNAPGTADHLVTLARDALLQVPCRFLEWIGYDRLYADAKADAFTPLPTPSPLDDLLAPAMAFHSSGSTSFPKPIVYTHLSILYSLHSFNYSQWSFTDRLVFMGHLPSFHILCFLLVLTGNFGNGSVAALFPPQCPPAPVNPSSTLVTASRLASWVVVPPIFVEIWAQDEESIRLMKKFDLVGFGGGPLLREVGEMLVKRGVKLCTFYSSTEVGQRVQFDIYRDPAKWEWNKNIPTIRTFFRRQEDTEQTGHFELLVAAGDRYLPNAFNDKHHGVAVFATNDLVERHPDDADLYRVVGRKDDQIMLSTGEKTNPAPLIGLVQRSKLVKSCLYTGRGKTHNAILVEPVQPIDIGDEAEVARYRNAIWGAVEAANAFAPVHSRIYKEMIVVGSLQKPFERTAKGTLRTGVTLQAYEAEIEAAYDAFKASAEFADSIVLPDQWDLSSTTSVVHAITASSLERDTLNDHDDVFLKLGADSLVATKIRNSIAASLARGQPGKVTRLPMDIVYRNPTVHRLGEAVLCLINGEDKEEPGNADARLTAMQAMVEKYSTEWPQLGSGRADNTGGTVALVTGTTGGLGAHMLEKLIRRKDIHTVWALNRPQASASLLDRQKAAFAARGLDVGLLSDARVRLVEADLRQVDLGVSAAVYDEIVSSVTIIYHIAWRLDFNLSLASFEENIQGTRRLIDIALHAAAALFFTSSIGVAIRATEHPVMEVSLPFEASVGLGYGESKAVAERLLEMVRRERGLRTCNVRIGQLSGSTTNGCWATTDWVPIMVKSAITMGKLPTGGAPVTWLATDICADALLDLPSDGQTRHILHPRPIRWDTVIQHFCAHLSLLMVPYPDWATALERESIQSTSPYVLAAIPAIKLMDFFHLQASSSHSIPSLNCTLSLAESAHLRSAPPLSPQDVGQWIAHWKAVGFLQPEGSRE